MASSQRDVQSRYSIRLILKRLFNSALTVEKPHNLQQLKIHINSAPLLSQTSPRANEFMDDFLQKFTAFCKQCLCLYLDCHRVGSASVIHSIFYWLCNTKYICWTRYKTGKCSDNEIEDYILKNTQRTMFVKSSREFKGMYSFKQQVKSCYIGYNAQYNIHCYYFILALQVLVSI